jgi:hypothetical protein
MAKMVINFESPHTYLSTEESLRQVCGVHTTFSRINHGYGLFPSKKICKLKEDSNITDWGWNEYNKLGSLVRNYFVKINGYIYMLENKEIHFYQ